MSSLARVSFRLMPLVSFSITAIVLSQSVLAGPCTLRNNGLLSQSTGDCLSKQPTPTDYFDALILEYSGSGKIRVENDVSAGNGFAGIWSDITIKGTGLARSDLNVLSISPLTYQEDGSRKTITTGKLTLDNVDLEADVVFKFTETNNELNFIDSSINWDTRDPSIQSGTNFKINALTGDNRWTAGDGLRIAAATTLDVASGASFEFFSAGRLTGGLESDRLRFSNGFNANLDNSALKFTRSSIDFGQSTINAINGSAISFSGSNTKINVSTLNLSDSSFTFGGGYMEFFSDTSNWHNTGINILDGEYHTKALNLSGSNTLSGDRSTERLLAEVLRTSDASATTLTANRVNQLRVETLLLSSNLTIDLDGSQLNMVTGSDLRLNGGTINLNQSGRFGIFGTVVGNDANINVNAGGELFVGSNSELELSAPLELNLTTDQSFMTVFGILSGEGSILGSGGDITIEGNDSNDQIGILSFGTSSNPYGTLAIDHRLSFSGPLSTTNQSLIDTGLFDGGYYDVDIGLTGGTTPINDKLVYGDYNVDISRMKALRIDVADNSTAAQLDKKSFRVIEASSGAAAGDIIYRGQTVDIEEGPNVPILIDFFVADDNTNGKADLTIYAEEVLPITLQRHSGVRTQRNTQAVAALVPASSTTPAVPSQPQTPAQQQAQQNVYNNLQTTTNSQVQGNFTSIHPEPISSNMTIQLEQADNMLNTVLSVNTLASSKDQDHANLGSYFFGSSHSNPTGVWANINYVDGKVDGQGDLGSFDYYLTSYIFGSSFINRSDYELGTFFGFSSEKMDEHDQANIDFSSSSYHLGLYGGLRFDEKLTMNWAFGHSWLSTESSRSTSLGSIQERAEAEYDSQMNYLGVRASYDTSWLQKIESSAFAGLGYLRVDQDAFSESNAPNLGLTVDSAVADSAILSLGVEMSRSLDVEERTHALVEVRYDYDALAEKNSEHDISASFSFDPSNKQDFVGQNRGSHALTLALGVDHEFEENCMLSLAGAYTRSSHGYEVGGDLVMNWYW